MLLVIHYGGSSLYFSFNFFICSFIILFLLGPLWEPLDKKDHNGPAIKVIVDWAGLWPKHVARFGPKVWAGPKKIRIKAQYFGPALACGLSDNFQIRPKFGLFFQT